MLNSFFQCSSIAVYAVFIPKPTCYGDEQLAQAGSKRVSSQHSTAKVARSLLVFFRGYHAVDEGEVGHLCGGHHSIIHLFPSICKERSIHYVLHVHMFLLFNHQVKEQA